ncbi:hypothetical protein ACT5GY_11605 [Lactiplantibacillus plantarum]
MYEHLVKNKFWFWKAMETYGLGIYFIIKHNTFAFEPPQPTLLDVLDDPPTIFMLAVVGTLALVYSLWNVHSFTLLQATNDRTAHFCLVIFYDCFWRS